MKIILAGGGTGGHLFPGIALAQTFCLKSQIPNPKSRILFLCTNRPFDKKQLERYKFNYYALPSPKLPSLKKPLSPIKFPFSLLLSLYHTNKYFTAFRPDVVVGLGGYGAFSSLVIAMLRGIPFVLLEQNILPGKITRAFHPFAKNVFCQWNKSAKYLRNRKSIKITGSPIRNEILLPTNGLINNKSNARKQLGISKEYILLIIGGSQGAEALNKGIIAKIDVLKKLSGRLGIIHLTGEKDYQMINDTYKNAGIEAVVKTFVDEMSLIYAASDFALSRAGGIAIAEMAIFGLPMILVPYPHAADNHQFLNALEIQESGAGFVINQNHLAKQIGTIINDFVNTGTKTLSQNAKCLTKNNTAGIIIDYLQSL